ncbi:MAG: hypothetical protein AAF968_25845 [Pseudomonadota bacterium]
MADPPKGPVFLQRPRYRRRRLQDAARLLPVLGGVLVMIPLIWQREGEAAMSTVGAFVYIFGVWVAMIVLAALIAPRLANQDQD